MTKPDELKRLERKGEWRRPFTRQEKRAMERQAKAAQAKAQRQAKKTTR